MKTWPVISGLMLLLLLAGFFTVTKLIMPKAAMAFVPAKWQNIPLGQKRSLLEEYLGKPLITSHGTETWRHNISNTKRYILKVDYRNDSIAGRYQIDYEFSWLCFSDRTSVRSDSLP